MRTPVTDLPNPVPPRLSLLGGFELTSGGRRCVLPLLAQRLIALLALRSGWVERGLLAETLWPDTPPLRGAANLRCAIWRLPRTGFQIVDARRSELRLSPGVRVDLNERMAQARRALAHSDVDIDRPAEVAGWGEVLPDWYDDWVLAAHNSFHALRIEILERVCARSTACGQYATAVDSGLAALEADPLRESAQQVLICAHLAEGNAGEALRQYAIYCDLLKAELGIEPSPTVQALVLATRHTGG